MPGPPPFSLRPTGALLAATSAAPWQWPTGAHRVAHARLLAWGTIAPSRKAPKDAAAVHSNQKCQRRTVALTCTENWWHLLSSDNDVRVAGGSEPIGSSSPQPPTLVQTALSSLRVVALSMSMAISSPIAHAEANGLPDSRELCAGVEQDARPLNVQDTVFHRAGRDIVICQAPGDVLSEEQGFAQGSSSVRGTGNRIWEASVVLTRFLESGLPPDAWHGKRVVELGGGQGLVSLVTAALGADEVFLTDGDQTSLDLAHTNLRINDLLSANGAPSTPPVSFEDSIRPTVLRWGPPSIRQVSPAGSPDQGRKELVEPDFILGADIMYNLRSLADLVYTLEDLSGDTTQVYIANRHRVPAQDDLQLLMLASAFEMEELRPARGSFDASADWLTGVGDKVSVYSLRKRQDGGVAARRVIADLQAFDEACDKDGPMACMYSAMEMKARANASLPT